MSKESGNGYYTIFIVVVMVCIWEYGFGDVGFWVCDSEEWLITVRERDVFLLRKSRYGFNTIVGAAGDEDGFDFVLLDVKKQYRFFQFLT